MSKLEALIFDVDGTLADTERDGHRIAFNLAFADAGLDWDWTPELYGELLAVTGGKERIRYYLEKFNTDYEVSGDLAEFAAGLHAAKTEHYMKLMEEGKIPLRPGVQRLLEEARKEGMRMAIATTTTPANVTALLASTLGPEAESWFEVVAAGDIVPKKKPAPDIFIYAMEKMGLSPEQCIAFEDSYNGIQSSSAAGLKTIITINEYTKDDDFSAATVVLNEMGEPGQPFSVLSGNVNDMEYLNLDLVRFVHSN